MTIQNTARVCSNFNQYGQWFLWIINKLNNISIDFLIDCGTTHFLLSQQKLSEVDPYHQLFRLVSIQNTLHTVYGEQISVAGSVDIVLKTRE